MENPCIDHFPSLHKLYLSFCISILIILLSLHLGRSLPELNKYDHVSEGGAKDARNKTWQR